MTWRDLGRSERTTIGRFQCDVWPIGSGARYSVLDTETRCYVKGGKCASVDWAKQVSTGFARSLLAIAGDR